MKSMMDIVESFIRDVVASIRSLTSPSSERGYDAGRQPGHVRDQQHHEEKRDQEGQGVAEDLQHRFVEPVGGQENI